MNNEPLIYSTGAKRSEALPKYRLIPAAALRIEAEAFTEGSAKYEIDKAAGTPTPLTSNWRKGDITFFLDALDHLTAHVVKLNNMVLELGLDYATAGSPTYSETLDNQAGFNVVWDKILLELGHARANTAFLAEWIDSGAADVHFRGEVARLQGIENQPPRDVLENNPGIREVTEQEMYDMLEKVSAEGKTVTLVSGPPIKNPAEKHGLSQKFKDLLAGVGKVLTTP